jgi:hypothetical protein
MTRLLALRVLNGLNATFVNKNEKKKKKKKKKKGWKPEG